MSRPPSESQCPRLDEADIWDIDQDEFAGLGLPAGVALAWPGWRYVWSQETYREEPFSTTTVLLRTEGWWALSVWPTTVEDWATLSPWSRHLMARLGNERSLVATNPSGLFTGSADGLNGGGTWIYQDMALLLQSIPVGVEPEIDAERFLNALTPPASA